MKKKKKISSGRKGSRRRRSKRRRRCRRRRSIRSRKKEDVEEEEEEEEEEEPGSVGFEFLRRVTDLITIIWLLQHCNIIIPRIHYFYHLIKGSLFSRQFCVTSQHTGHDSAFDLSGTGKVNSPSATNFKFLHTLKKLPRAWKSTDDLALWPESTVYVGYKKLRFQPVTYGSVEVIPSRQNKSPTQYMFILHLVVDSTKEFIQKIIWFVIPVVSL